MTSATLLYRRRRELLSMFMASAILSLSFTIVFGQSAQPQPSASCDQSALLKALLDEVRELRTTIQRNGLAQYRATLLADAIAKQRTLVGTISLELDRVRGEIRDLADQNDEDKELAESEAAYRAATPEARPVMEQALAALKRSVERQKQQAQRELTHLQVSEQQLNQRLLAEQAKLTSLEDEVKALERDLSLLPSLDRK